MFIQTDTVNKDVDPESQVFLEFSCCQSLDTIILSSSAANSHFPLNLYHEDNSRVGVVAPIKRSIFGTLVPSSFSVGKMV